MKKNYEAPDFCVERFELNETIASGCSTIVNLGPGDGEHEMCSDYPYIPEFFALSENPAYSNFYDSSCDCELTASNAPMFTS